MLSSSQRTTTTPDRSVRPMQATKEIRVRQPRSSGFGRKTSRLFTVKDWFILVDWRAFFAPVFQLLPRRCRRGWVGLAILGVLGMIWQQEFTNQILRSRAVALNRLGREMQNEHGPVFQEAPAVHKRILSRFQSAIWAGAIPSALADFMPKGRILKEGELGAQRELTLYLQLETRSDNLALDVLARAGSILSSNATLVLKNIHPRKIPFQPGSAVGVHETEREISDFYAALNVFRAFQSFTNGENACVASRVATIYQIAFLPDYIKAHSFGDVQEFSDRLEELGSLMSSTSIILAQVNKQESELLSQFASNVRDRKMDLDQELRSLGYDRRVHVVSR